MIKIEDLKQITVEEAIQILHNNPHGFTNTWSTKGGDRVKPAVFYIYNGYPEAIDIEEYTSEQLLDVLYAYHLYTQDTKE